MVSAADLLCACSFYPLRYIQWAHSTPSLLLMLSLMSSVGLGEVVGAVVCDVVMILTGLWACYATGLSKGTYLSSGHAPGRALHEQSSYNAHSDMQGCAWALARPLCRASFARRA